MVFVLLALSLALVYKLVPAARVWWRGVWLGSAITAILILLGERVVRALARGTKIDSVLEVASAIVLILTGIYYASLIVIIGGMVCKVFADTFGSLAE